MTNRDQFECWQVGHSPLTIAKKSRDENLTDPNVIIVMLRQPRGKDLRTDPIWEFGSFGLTGCHRRNLLNPRKAVGSNLDGSILAFAQGGKRGGLSEVRLVHVTPPVKLIRRGCLVEATWQPFNMPLAYDSAPLLIDNDGNSDAPLIKQIINEARRKTPVARFASKFRARCRPLCSDIGRQVIASYQTCVQRGATVARCYVDSLPFRPTCIDQDREGTYEKRLVKLENCFWDEKLFASKGSKSCG